MDDLAARSRKLLAGESVAADFLRTRAETPTALEPESRETLLGLRRRAVRSGLLSPRGYNLTISHAHRFLWFRVAKVGTRSLLAHFESGGVELDVESAANLRYPTALVEDYFAFAFVRHPVDRFVSAWQDKAVNANYFGFEPAQHERVQDPAAFVSYAESLDLDRADRHIAPQTRLIDLTRVDFLGRMETFAADVAQVCDRLDIPAAEFPRKNVTGARSDTLDPGVRRRIVELYRRDFQILGYAPEAGEHHSVG